MQLCKAQLDLGSTCIAVIENDRLHPIEVASLSEILHAESPTAVINMFRDHDATQRAIQDVQLLAPVDQQEVWAAGVTYLRSKDAREKESEGAAQFYDLVYTADRPEIFFKSPAERVVPTGGRIRIRKDSKWNVPEPEIALVISPKLQIVGFTIGNDVSSRDIEGENPLYLPQAKFYDGSCALGPVITLADAMPSGEDLQVRMRIERQGSSVFEGETDASRLKRTFEELVEWLSRELSFPNGAILMTGTGIVPDDNFTLEVGDKVIISVTGIGELINVVDQRP